MESSSIPQSSKTSLNLDASIYPLIAAQKAAYEFSSRACCVITQTDDNKISIELGSLLPNVDASQLAREFISRIADFSLQTKIDCQTRLVREALVAAAMSEAFRK